METLYKKIIQAVLEGEPWQSKELMEGYTPYQMEIAYKVIEHFEGYASAQAAKRGEHSYIGKTYLGLN